MHMIGNGDVSESTACRETFIWIERYIAQRSPEIAASLAAKVGKQDEGVLAAFRLLPEILNILAGGSTSLLKELGRNPIRKPADLASGIWLRT